MRPHLEELLERGKKANAKVKEIQKLILPSLKEQNRKARVLYESRKPGDLLGLKLTNFKQIEKALDGLQDGFYLIGADSNSGKTALSYNLCLDVVETNPSVTCLYFSLDDSAEDILTRMRANIAGVEINDVKLPWRIDDKDKLRLAEAYKKLDELDGRLFVLDQETVVTFSNLIHYIEQAKAQNPNKRLAIFIDAILNLDTEEDSSKQIRELNITRANKLKELVGKYSLPLICTVELRKRNKPEEMPTIFDIMESGKYGYNANLVWMLHATPEEMEKDEPQLTFLWRKNKLSAFKGKAALSFKKKYAKMEEMPWSATAPTQNQTKCRSASQKEQEFNLDDYRN